jgi:hypothetical protein
VHVEIISESEELVTETLKDLRKEVEAREEVNEKETLEHVSSLTCWVSFLMPPITLSCPLS